MVHHRTSRWRSRQALTALVATLGITLAGCSTDSPVGASPQLPAAPLIPPQYRGAAWTAEVSTLRKTVRFVPPQGTILRPNGQANANVVNEDMIKDAANAGVSQSLLGADVLDLVPTNFVAGPLGGVVPNKILITFSVQINNKLASVDLIRPTFPTPPPSATGVLLFPFEIQVTTTSGGVQQGGNSNEVVVSSPRFGAVQASSDWGGAPWNFFNDAGCTAGSNDCFPYEEYAPIPALGSSAPQTIGFLIDPTVGDFTVKMILAGDLRNAGGPAQFGTVAGTVTSPQLGNLNNVTVNVSGGFTGTTNASGAYSITNVGVGSRSVSLANLPAGCVAPASQNVTVTNGATSTANFSVTCQVPTGTISGTISSSLGGGIANASVTVTPNGGSALAPATTGGTGGYSVSNVPVSNGTGTVALGNLPAGCTNPGATNYTGLTQGGTVTVNITVTCTAPPTTGTVTGTITSNASGNPPVSGVTVTLTPQGGSALAGVQTNASGVYSRNLVPPGSGTIALSTLPAGCTAPPSTPYSGVTAGGTVTVNIQITCPQPFNYPVTGSWSQVTGGPTGRQLLFSMTIDMGAAPGRPDVNGPNADELVGIQLVLGSLPTGFQYQSRTLPDANMDLAAINQSGSNLNVAVTSSQNLTSSGLVNFVVLRINIPTGFAGPVNLTGSLTEILAGTFAAPVNATTTGVITIPPVTVP